MFCGFGIIVYLCNALRNIAFPSRNVIFPLYYANSIGGFWSHPSWVCGLKLIVEHVSIPYKLSKRGK